MNIGWFSLEYIGTKKFVGFRNACPNPLFSCAFRDKKCYYYPSLILSIQLSIVVEESK